MKESLVQRLLRARSSLGFWHMAEYAVKSRLLERPEGLLHRLNGTNRSYRLGARFLPCNLDVRSCTSDLSTFWGVICRQQYCVPELPSRPSWIFDCGANVGYASAFFLSRYPDAGLVAVEPDPHNFSFLKKNVSHFGSRVELVRGGLWSSEGGLKCTQALSGSRREWALQVRPCMLGEASDVEGVTVASLVRKFSIRRINILKMDVEGAEIEVFRDHTDWLGLVDTILIELHGKACAETFHRAVEPQGFNVVKYGEVTVASRQLTRSV